MKGILELPGMREIKNIHTTEVRAIPKLHRSNYLELYMLKREKDRLEKEMFALEKRKESTLMHLRSICSRLEHIHIEIEKEAQEKKNHSGQGMPQRALKTMHIKY